jgi:hypothetical protein
MGSKGDTALDILHVNPLHQRNHYWGRIDNRVHLIGDQATLELWNDIDPVDAEEIHRNMIFKIQGNRKSYIDNPAWVPAANAMRLLESHNNVFKSICSLPTTSPAAGKDIRLIEMKTSPSTLNVLIKTSFERTVPDCNHSKSDKRNIRTSRWDHKGDTARSILDFFHISYRSGDDVVL